MRIREATQADLDAIRDICLRTGDHGADATGLFCDDSVLADVYAVPYLKGPGGFALVVHKEDAAARADEETALAAELGSADEPGPAADAPVADTPVAVGYVLGTFDTRAFQEWFSDQWWPERREGREPRTDGDRWLLSAAEDPTRMFNPWLEDYPAHLHIDLLPEAQGRGAGRRLIEAAVTLLRDYGVPGVHLEAPVANDGAQEFYPRVGFEELARDDHTVTWGCRLCEWSHFS